MIYYLEYTPATDDCNIEHATIQSHYYDFELNKVTKTQYHGYTEYTINIEHPGPIHEALGEGIRLILVFIEEER